MSQYVSHEAAAEALDSLDDYARMGTGVDAYGPRGMLERYIAQQAATLRQPAARVDEGMLRNVLGNVVKSMRATGRSWGPTRHAQVLDTWADEIETTVEAALSAQPAPELDVRKYVRHLADVLEAGVGYLKVDADLARLGAAIQAAQPAPERQGELSADVQRCLAFRAGARWADANPRNSSEPRVMQACRESNTYAETPYPWTRWPEPATHPAAPVGVPDDNSASVAAIQFALSGEDGMAFLRCWNEGNFDACRNEWPEAPAECYIGADPFAAPSAPQGTQQGEE